MLRIVNYKKAQNLSSSISAFGVLQKPAMFQNKSTKISAPSNSRVSALFHCCFDDTFSNKCMQMVLINLMFPHSEGRTTFLVFLHISGGFYDSAPNYRKTPQPKSRAFWIKDPTPAYPYGSSTYQHSVVKLHCCGIFSDIAHFRWKCHNVLRNPPISHFWVRIIDQACIQTCHKGTWNISTNGDYNSGYKFITIRLFLSGLLPIFYSNKTKVWEMTQLPNLLTHTLIH